MASHIVHVETLWNSIPALYAECLVGKSFEDYLQKRFSKTQQLRTVKIERALGDYEKLAISKFEEQKESIQSLYSNAIYCGDFGSEENGFIMIGKSNHFTNLEKRNLGVLSEKPGETGAVFAPKKWSLLKNDTMILGAIHALKEFRIVQNSDCFDSFSAELCNDKTGLPTIFAREVAILEAAGYRPFFTNAGIILASHEDNRAVNFSFYDISKVVNNISIKRLQDFLNSSEDTRASASKILY